jgi:hypothetical protein
METFRLNPSSNNQNADDSFDEGVQVIDFEGFQLWDQRNQTLAYFDFPIKQDFDFYTRMWTEKKYVIFH